MWANGLDGKAKKLIIPITKGTSRGDIFKALTSRISDIHKQRNGVAHRGEFKIKKTSIRVIKETREVIQALVQQYDQSFSLSLPDEDAEDEDT